MVSKKIKNWEKAKHIKKILLNKNTNHGGNDDHTGYGKHDIDIICKPNQKIFGQRMYQDR